MKRAQRFDASVEEPENQETLAELLSKSVFATAAAIFEEEPFRQVAEQRLLTAGYQFNGQAVRDALVL